MADHPLLSRIFSVQLLMSVILYAPKMVLISFQFYMSDCKFAMHWAPITLCRYDLEQFCILIFRECVCSQFLRAREKRNRPRFGWVASWRLGMFFTRYTLSLVQTCKPGELVAAQRFLSLAPLCFFWLPQPVMHTEYQSEVWFLVSVGFFSLWQIL